LDFWAAAAVDPKEGPPASAPAATAPAESGAESGIEDRLAKERWSGDLEGMVQRRFIRALVIYGKTFYFLDGATQKGITYEALREFETFLNQRLKTGKVTVHVILVPVSRDQTGPALAEGRGSRQIQHRQSAPSCG
jgi:hypothetical protein